MEALPGSGLGEAAVSALAQAPTYFRNHHQRMNYAERAAAKLPMGSGVTEAAGKTSIKMRMCRGGAKGQGEGARAALSWRTLIDTEGRWEQCWAKIDRHGFPGTNAAELHLLTALFLRPPAGDQ
jgi:hypothetical protein